MEKYSDFEMREVHPLKKYVGWLAYFFGAKLEVVGYRNDAGSARVLIADGTKMKGLSWEVLDTFDVVFKDCESYCYVLVDDLLYRKLW